MTDRRDHRGQPPAPHHTPPPQPSGPADIFADHRPTAIKHVFVLMLENRSFDHMLGFSGIEGTDAKTGQPTRVDGLTGNEFNEYKGQRYTVKRGAPDTSAHGPAHDFENVLRQMCEENATFPSGGAYPRITNGGYVADYSSRSTELDVPMRCFTPDQLPILTTLAKEFCVGDHWYSSMPGPTWPNRMFAHAASSGGIDDPVRSVEFDLGFVKGDPSEGLMEFGVASVFKGQSIFAALRKAGKSFRIYADDHMPNVAELSDISVFTDIHELEDMRGHLHGVDGHAYTVDYTFIEPSYDALDDFDSGNSQHPLGSVAAGERLIKRVYEAIRNSPVWTTSALIITYDEHGGFYDHVVPPQSALPHVVQGTKGRYHGFMFDQLGPRVPAIVVSPLIPKNMIEHRPFEHSSIPATVERVFNVPAMRTRDAHVNAINHLATLRVARTDTPATLPDVAQPANKADRPATNPMQLIASDPNGNWQALLRNAVKQHLEVAPAGEHDAIIAHGKTIKTIGQLKAYLAEVTPKVKAKRGEHRIVAPPVVRPPMHL